MFENLLESAPRQTNRAVTFTIFVGIGAAYLSAFVLTLGYGIVKLQPKLQPPEPVVSCFFIGEGFLEPTPKDPIQPTPMCCEWFPTGCGVPASDEEDEETTKQRAYFTYFSTVCNKVMPVFPAVQIEKQHPFERVSVEIHVEPSGRILYAKFIENEAPAFKAAVHKAIGQWVFKPFEPTKDEKVRKGELNFTFDLKNQKVQIQSNPLPIHYTCGNGLSYCGL